MAKHTLIHDGRNVEIDVSKTQGGYIIKVADQIFSAEVDGAAVCLSGSAGTTRGAFAATRERVFVESDGGLFEFDILSADSDSVDHAGFGEMDKVRAPMPGKIVKVLIEIGDQVEAKQALAIIESMKMENQLLSPAKGAVKAIHFNPGDQVDADAVIIELEIEEQS